MSNKPFHPPRDLSRWEKTIPNTIYSLPITLALPTSRRNHPESGTRSLTLLAQQAFHDASFYAPPGTPETGCAILHDPEASENDKYVALQFLRLSKSPPRRCCRPARTPAPRSSSVKKGQRAWTGGGDEEALSKSIAPISKITCAIHRMRRWTCTKRSTPALTCLRKSTCTR
ncbi:hypothetical protein ACNKHR_09870 [Shigella flexneri]